MIFLIDDTYFLFSLFFVCSKSGTLLRQWPTTAPESAQRTGRSSHSRTVHPKTGEHHREQSRQPSSGCAGPAIAGTPAQGQRAGRSAAPDSKSMSVSVSLRCLLYAFSFATNSAFYKSHRYKAKEIFLSLLKQIY